MPDCAKLVRCLGRVRYGVATKHIVGLENRFPSFILKRGVVVRRRGKRATQVYRTLPDVRPHLGTNTEKTADGVRALRLNKNDWAIGGQHLGRDHLGLKRCGEVVDRRPVGVIVDDPEP